MLQTDALRILDAGASVFLTGAPGAGKTYVLNEFIKQARARGASVAVTASTGIAATHLNGQTIHSWSGVGVAEAMTDSLLKQIKTRRGKRIRATDILVIDEISMMHAWLFDMVGSGMPRGQAQSGAVRRATGRHVRRPVPAAPGRPCQAGPRTCCSAAGNGRHA